MISKLRLLISRNPAPGFVRMNTDGGDLARIDEWYALHTGGTHSPDTALDTFLWCLTDGMYALDVGIYNEALSHKAAELNVSVETLDTLFNSHETLFGDDNGTLVHGFEAPVFIVFEGLDGSGKSTQINMLRDKMLAAGRKVCVTAEPTESATGGLIRDALCGNHPRDPSELAALFLTDRIAHNVNPAYGIKKLLDEGNDVICDRYYYSSFAYQGIDTDINWVMDMNLNCPRILKPDLCVFLDVDPRRCMSRIDGRRTHREIFEKDAAILERIRARFYDVIERLNPTENIRIIDANRPVGAVADRIAKTVM